MNEKAIREALEDWELKNWGEKYICRTYDPEDAERIIKRGVSRLE